MLARAMFAMPLRLQRAVRTTPTVRPCRRRRKSCSTWVWLPPSSRDRSLCALGNLTQWEHSFIIYTLARLNFWIRTFLNFTILSKKSIFGSIRWKILFYYYSDKNPFGLLAFREKSAEKNPSEKPPITSFLVSVPFDGLLGVQRRCSNSR